MSARATAARCLQRVIYEGESLTEVLQDRAVASLPHQDQALLRDMCFGALRWHERLSRILALLLSKALKKADKDVECLLRIGLYQLIYQRTPDHAAVNETVSATKKLKKDWAGKLVNGVLRSFLRGQAELLAQADAQPAARYAFPDWLLTRIQQAWPDDWETILSASNTHAPMTLRVNQRQYTAAAYQQILQEAGIIADFVPPVASALNLQTPDQRRTITGFQPRGCLGARCCRATRRRAAGLPARNAGTGCLRRPRWQNQPLAGNDRRLAPDGGRQQRFAPQPGHGKPDPPAFARPTWSPLMPGMWPRGGTGNCLTASCWMRLAPPLG